MKAIVCTKYGMPDVLQLREVPRPPAKKRDVSVKIHATAVNTSDCFIRSGIPTAPLLSRTMLRLVIGIQKPRQPILGLVLSGEIDRIGEAVTRFQKGDRVYGFTGIRFGTYAEYAVLPESGIIARIPANVSYEEAAAIPYGALLALSFLRKGNIENRQRVVVYGASGAVGTAAVQLAKYFGARVTAICGPENLGLMCALGADSVLDYTRTSAVETHIDCDFFFDAAGKRKTSALKEALRKALAPGAAYICVDDGTPKITVSDLDMLTELLTTAQLTPVIDRCYPLEETASAHQYVEQQHKKGNVIIAVAPD